jgi:hypothetical protein
MTKVWAVGLIVLSGVTASVAQPPAADLIITNARVWTVDKARPTADAIAIRGDRVVAVGTAPEIDGLRGARTRVIDGRGRSLLPGFNDAHVHLLRAGARLDMIDLKNVDSAAELARRVGERARATPKGQWILGGEWDDQRWTPAGLPTAALIDAGTSDNPVFLHRYDGHMALANSIALKLAGVTARTLDPPGGTIVRDAQGHPTGVLKDGALALVAGVVPPLTPEQRRDALQAALAHLASFGVTSVHDVMTEWETVELYGELDREGALTARLYSLPVAGDWLQWRAEGRKFPPTSPWLHVDGVKARADGSLGSTTAYFFEAYTDAPETRGLLMDEMQPVEAMRDRLTRADAAGGQIAVHAIGDQANSLVLDIFESIVRTNAPRDRRFRIEHAQHLARKDFDRFARIPVIASVQPYHAIDDGRWAEKRIGSERIKTTYAFRTLLDRGVRLALGTDWFHAPLDPMQTLYAAVTRATTDGKNSGGWVPEQKITLPEAVEAYTLGSAYAEFREKDKGSIAVGKLADVVLLSDDLFAVPPERIRDVRVDVTVVGGKVVHERQSVSSR